MKTADTSEYRLLDVVGDILDMPRVMLIGDFLGERHDGGDNCQLPIRDQNPERFPPDRDEVIYVLRIVGLADLAIHAVVLDVPVGGAGYSQRDTLVRQTPQRQQRILVDDLVYATPGRFPGSGIL